MDWTSIICAVVALLGTAIGSYSGLRLTSYRVEQLEKKVDKHNRFAAEFCEAFHPQFGAWFDMELKKHAALGKRKISALLRRWLEIVGGDDSGILTTTEITE